MLILGMKTKQILIFAFVCMVAIFCKIAIAEDSSNLRTDKNIYKYGESVIISFFNAPGYENDWLCIVPEGAQDTDPGDYQYIPKGLSNGTLTFNAPVPGKYEARAYYDYKRKGYVASHRVTFSVARTPEGEAAARSIKNSTASNIEEVVPISDTNNCQFIKTAYFEVSHPSKMHYYASLNTSKAGGDSYKILYSGEEKVFGMLILKTNIAIFKCKKEIQAAQ